MDIFDFVEVGLGLFYVYFVVYWYRYFVEINFEMGVLDCDDVIIVCV